MQETARQTGHTEDLEIGQTHGGEPDLDLAAGQRIAEFRGRPERRGTGGDDTHVRIMIGGDLEQLRRVVEPVDLVEHRTLAVQTIEEGLRIPHQLAYPGQLAVEVLHPGQALAEHRLAYAPHPRESDK